MSTQEPRQIASEDVKQAYAVTVEQVIVELLQISGATSVPGDNIMNNLQELGGKIIRHVAEMWEHEIITLEVNGEITHVGQVIVQGDEVIHIINTKDEFEKGLKENGTKKS